MITFTIYGNPVAQGRPKTFILKDKEGRAIRPVIYDPQNSRQWKDGIRAQSIPFRPPAPLEGALKLELRFYLARPKSLPKKVVDHIKKPDLKNLISAVEDSLSGVFFHDDRQIVWLDARKFYGVPRVEIGIGELGT